MINIQRRRSQVTTLRVDKLEGLRQQDREETARVHDHGIRQVHLGC